MSRRNYDKPFYVDVGTSIAAIRCASNYDDVFSIDLEISKLSRESIIESCKKMCDRMNREAEIFMEKRNQDVAKEPLRNCDVGTPQEQAARWNDYCDDVTRGDCPPSAGCRSCALYWAQMPYNEGGAK